MSNTTPTPKDTSLEAIEARLKQIQLARLEREEQEILEAKQAKDNSRKAGIDSVKNKMTNDKYRQEMCAHLKENGRTHLAGQKDHSGTIILICQGCQKEFRSDASYGSSSFIPPHLFPKGDGAVGGPH